jgi:membrane protease YdiL (CAAX protease family)
VPLFLITLSLVGIVYGFLRMWTGSVWPVAIAHAAANMAWEIMTEMTQTKSALVLEYIGGESGLIMIGGLSVMGFVLTRYMRSERFRRALEE